jgi:hypothetical protein
MSELLDSEVFNEMLAVAEPDKTHVTQVPKRQVDFSGLLKASIKGMKEDGPLIERPIAGVHSYLSEIDLNETDKEYLRGYAKLAASNLGAATEGSPTIGSYFNMLLGTKGPYSGQPVYDLKYLLNSSNPIETGKAQREYYESNNMRPSPDMLSILFNEASAKDEGLTETDLRPSGGYPWRGDTTKVYDLNPYTSFKGLETYYPEEVIELLENLEKGSILSVNDIRDKVDSEAVLRGLATIDLNKMNESFGRDEEGLYIALADIFDVKGSTGPAGDLMEMLDLDPINLYGRKYIDNPSEFVQEKWEGSY